MEEHFKAYTKLVREMRNAQINYFSLEYGTKAKRDALDRSKALEKQVDKFQLPWEDISEKQTKLF